MKINASAHAGKTKPKQTQNKPNPRKAKMNLTFYSTKDYENVPLRWRRENKPNQTQFLKIQDNLSMIISAPFLTGLDYHLFFEHFACQVIGKGYLDCQGFFEPLDFVGHIECQSVIDD